MSKIWFWSHFAVLLKSDLDVQQTHNRFVEQKVMLSSNFRCYQIHNCQRYHFGHTLLCYLSPTWMFNRTTTGLLNIRSCLAPTLGVTKFINVKDMILVTLCCVTEVRLRCSIESALLWLISYHEHTKTQIN